MPKYIAKQSVGHFLPGDEIKGLDAERIQALLASGAIEEYKAPEQTPSDESPSDLKKLLGEVADLKATNTQLTEENTKAFGEVADLKAKITKLETDLAAATAKSSKTGKATADETAEKGAPESTK
ncbi:hypothetical protein F895_02609 [Acinetobacter sp. CIP 64.2]|uniref:hypothetical protein n=1 Tax=Acinetobacter sp. CIP 64.2 TaxID=1217694 RepID=UPI000288B1E8|nr:hypothetical protein [Acinetobacter sp. CIP 64.2]ENX13305.1 hypothetical protein F895_02609 [Acinetobacter sp. CIP 64.2]